MNSLGQKSKVCAVIPFYNEKTFIKDVVLRTLNYVDTVIAVNDGSTDNSQNTIEGVKNVLAINYSQNFGKGYALQRGFEESIKLGFDEIVTLDSDGQHNPELIPDLLYELTN